MQVPKGKRGNLTDWNRRILKDAQAGRFLSKENSAQLATPASLAFQQPARERSASLAATTPRALRRCTSPAMHTHAVRSWEAGLQRSICQHQTHARHRFRQQCW